MKRVRFLLLLLVPILFSACETVNQQDRAVLRAHEVSSDVYDKMVYGDPLSLQDVVELSQHAVPAGLIIRYMDRTDTAYRLGKADVKRLRAAGVNEQVISYMLSTSAPYAPGPYPYASYPYPYYPYNYYYGPYAGPVVVVGGGYRYGGWGGGGWGHGGYGHSYYH